MRNLYCKSSVSAGITSGYSVYRPESGTVEAQVMIRSGSRLNTLRSWLSIADELHRIRQELDFPENALLFLRVFCSDIINQAKILRENFPAQFGLSMRQNISIVQQPPLPDSKLAAWAYLVKGDTPVRQTEFGNHFYSNGLTHYWTANLSGSESDPVALQTEQMFARYIRLLASHNLDLMKNAIRTWIFVRDVDSQYMDMAGTRKLVFKKEGLTDLTHYIASTGIEGRNENPGHSVFMDAFSISGLKPEQVRYLQAGNHMCPTHHYGVTFERGATIIYGDRKHIYLSGTASISNKGQILFPDDPGGQVSRIIENMEALLMEAGAGLSDLTCLIVYLRDIADYKLVRKKIMSILPGLPAIFLQASICRPGWLVEAEGVAVCDACTQWPKY